MEMRELTNRFEYHPPVTPQRVRDHEKARKLFQVLAIDLNEALPEGREKSLVMTKIEEAMFWANAAIAREQVEG